MELRQQIIDLLSKVLDKNVSELSKEMIKHNRDITEIYRKAHDSLFSDIITIINDLDARKESK